MIILIVGFSLQSFLLLHASSHSWAALALADQQNASRQVAERCHAVIPTLSQYFELYRH